MDANQVVTATSFADKAGPGWADQFQRALATIRERARALRWRETRNIAPQK